MAGKALMALLILGAAVGTLAQDVCQGTGYYHLSCYAASVSQDAAEAAKTQCFNAFNRPECNASIVDVPAGTGGCPTPVLYKFDTMACRDDYQAQEKTNTACSEYNSLGLGESSNRADANTSPDYNCPARRLF